MDQRSFKRHPEFSGNDWVQAAGSCRSRGVSYFRLKHFRSVRGQTILPTMYSNFVTKIKLLPPGGEHLI
jgi:hypothetical protein